MLDCLKYYRCYYVDTICTPPISIWHYKLGHEVRWNTCDTNCTACDDRLTRSSPQCVRTICTPSAYIGCALRHSQCTYMHVYTSPILIVCARARIGAAAVAAVALCSCYWRLHAPLTVPCRPGDINIIVALVQSIHRGNLYECMRRFARAHVISCLTDHIVYRIAPILTLGTEWLASARAQLCGPVVRSRGTGHPR